MPNEFNGRIKTQKYWHMLMPLWWRHQRKRQFQMLRIDEVRIAFHLLGIERLWLVAFIATAKKNTHRRRLFANVKTCVCSNWQNVIMNSMFNQLDAARASTTRTPSSFKIFVQFKQFFWFVFRSCLQKLTQFRRRKATKKIATSNNSQWRLQFVQTMQTSTLPAGNMLF